MLKKNRGYCLAILDVERRRVFRILSSNIARTDGDWFKEISTILKEWMTLK